MSDRTRPMRPLRRPLLVALLAGVALSGCRDEQAGPKRRQAPTAPATQAAGAAVNTAPAGRVIDEVPGDLTFRSGATWAGGTMRYHGSRMEPANAAPGQPVRLSHFFEALRPPPSGYGFFTHVIDPNGGGMIANADHEVAGGSLPLDRWPVGRIVVDEHTVVMPPPGARLVLGFWNDSGRMPVDQQNLHDGQLRVWGPTFTSAGAAGASASTDEGGRPLPVYKTRKVSTPPVIDGDLSDEAWRQAEEVTLAGSFDGRRTSVRTTARIVWDDAALYVAFDAEDPDIWGTLKNRDDPIYNEEVVEVFIDANGDGRTYNELQVSPHNVNFDAYFVARRSDLPTAMKWDSQMTSAVKVQGTLDDPSDRDGRWTVELRIPYGPLAELPNNPPRPGDRWRFNLYRLEHPNRRGVEGQSFSPLFVGDFHHLPRFGWLVFGE